MKSSFLFYVLLFGDLAIVQTKRVPKRPEVAIPPLPPTAADENTFDVIFGGDVTFRGIVEYHVQKGDCTYDRSFENIKPIFKNDAHEVVVNSESVFGTSKELESEKADGKNTVFYSNVKAVGAFSYAGIRQVVVANNHFLDFSEKGAKITLRELTKNNIKTSGVEYKEDNEFKSQEPLILEHNGIRIGILSYCDIENGCMHFNDKTTIRPAQMKIERVMKDLKNLKNRKPKVHGSVVYFHQGDEYQVLQNNTVLFKENLQKLSKYADVIVSDHAHIPSRHYFYRNTLGTGQLGNLLFPMHMTPDHELSIRNEDNDGSEDEKIDKFWYKLTTRRRNRSARGKLVKVSFNRNGFVKHKSQYMYVNIRADKNHCLYIDPGKNPTWTKICGKGDKSCEGTSDCNYLECKL